MVGGDSLVFTKNAVKSTRNPWHSTKKTLYLHRASCTVENRGQALLPLVCFAVGFGGNGTRYAVRAAGRCLCAVGLGFMNVNVI